MRRKNRIKNKWKKIKDANTIQDDLMLTRKFVVGVSS
jgi:hypothetical protein